jgi:hypothetical protein
MRSAGLRYQLQTSGIRKHCGGIVGRSSAGGNFDRAASALDLGNGLDMPDRVRGSGPRRPHWFFDQLEALSYPIGCGRAAAKKSKF